MSQCETGEIYEACLSANKRQKIDSPDNEAAEDLATNCTNSASKPY